MTETEVYHKINTGWSDVSCNPELQFLPRFQNEKNQDYIGIIDDYERQEIAYFIYQQLGVDVPEFSFTQYEDNRVLIVQYCREEKPYTDLSLKLLASYTGMSPLSGDEMAEIGRILAVSLLLNDRDVLGGDHPNHCKILHTCAGEIRKFPMKIGVGAALLGRDLGRLDPIQQQEGHIYLTSDQTVPFADFHPLVQSAIQETLANVDLETLEGELGEDAYYQLSTANNPIVIDLLRTRLALVKQVYCCNADEHNLANNMAYSLLLYINCVCQYIFLKPAFEKTESGFFCGR